MYGLTGKFTSQEGQRDTLASLLVQAANQMGGVEGCKVYLVALDAEDPTGIWVYEVWESQEAHTASLQLEAVRALITAARPYIAGMDERRELTPLGGLGMTTGATVNA
jgi:quinol monooxygenase YgiN